MSITKRILEGLKGIEKSQEIPKNIPKGKTYQIDKKTTVRIKPPRHGKG